MSTHAPYDYVEIFSKGHKPDERFSVSIGRHVAELSADILSAKAHLSLRPGLAQLARSLLAQYANHRTESGSTRTGRPVVGIRIVAVEFTFIFGAEPVSEDEP